MAAPAWQDYFNTGKAEAQNRRPELTFDNGDISEMYTAAMAAMADMLTGYAAGKFRDTYLDGAQGDALTTLADDHWNIQRNPAQSSTVTVRFARASFSAGAGTIPAGTTVATVRDSKGAEVRFLTSSDVSFASTDLGPHDVVAIAETPGVGGNVAAATVTRIIDNLWDTSLTLTNAQRAAGGADAESDESLRERVRNYPATLRRATLAALEYGALTVDGVATAVAEESNTGIVSVYVADASGGSNSTLTLAVQAELENWRAAGVSVNVLGGSLFNLTPITISLSVRTGVDSAALAAQIKLAVVARLAKLKIGESCSPTIIKQAAMNVDPDGILDVTVSSPAATVVPTAGQLIRTTTADVSVS